MKSPDEEEEQEVHAVGQRDEAQGEYLKAWRDPTTGRSWPHYCSLSTETLDGDDFERAVDLVMTDRGRSLSAMHADDRNGLLARALATIRELRERVLALEETEMGEKDWTVFPVPAKDWEALSTVALERYLREIQATLDQRSGKPTEKAVRGDLLIAFDADWPAGWCWEDEPLWGGDPDDRPEQEAPPLDPATFYDLTDWYLEHERTMEKRTLWEVFSEWRKNHARHDDILV